MTSLIQAADGRPGGRTGVLHALGVAILLAAGMSFAPAAVGARGDACWTERRLPAGNGRLTEVVVSRGGGWILGVAPSERDARPIALRSRGSSWAATRVPIAGVSGLIGGDVSRSGTVWAVGFRRPGQVMQPVAVRWQRGRWSSVPVPEPVGAGAVLADVEILADGAVWAGGARLAGGRLWPYVLERLDGGWSRRDPPLEGGEGALTALTSGPAGSLWAAGWRLDKGATRPWVLRLDDSGWTTLPVADPGPGQVVLTDIDVLSASQAWASGYRVPPDRVGFEPLLLSWDGSAWSSVPLPWADGTSAILHGVTADRNGALLLTGARVARNNGRNRAFVARFVGGRWRRSLAPTGRYHNSELTDAAWIRHRPHLVGASATHSLYVTGCGTSKAAGPDGASRAQAPEADAGTPSPGPVRSPDPAASATLPAEPDAASSPDPTAGPLGGTVGARRSQASGRQAPRRVVFRDVARRAGLYEVSETWGSVAADFDADGRADLWLGRHNRLRPRLLLAGRGGRFQRVAPAAFRLRDRHGCAAGDVDADGHPDLFCSIGANRGTNMTSDELWLGVGTRKRHQRTGDYGLVDPLGRGRTAVFLHLDGDPYPELFVGNEPQRSDALPSHDRLYRNDAGQRYLPAPEQGVDRSMGSLCATAGDIDDDGDEDLIVCASEPWGGLVRGVRIFRNDAGQLRHATTELGVRPSRDVDAVVADLDGDGSRDDLARLGPDGLHVSLGHPGGQDAVYQRAVTVGVGLAAGDVDGDGRDDLYVQRGGRGNQPDLLLVGRQGGRRWISRPIPQARGGLADDVVALDHDRNGLVDFFVTNGRQSTGPTQLIAAYRR